MAPVPRSSTDRRSISLTAPQLAYLRQEATRLGVSISDLIRRIIDHYRDTQKEPTA